jgi:addiction module HigA family antidote
MDLTKVALAKHLGILRQRVNEIVRGKRGSTPDTARLLSQAFGTTLQFWLNLQNQYE